MVYTENQLVRPFHEVIITYRAPARRSAAQGRWQFRVGSSWSRSERWPSFLCWKLKAVCMMQSLPLSHTV